MAQASVKHSSFRIALSGAEVPPTDTGVPVLAGGVLENLFGEGRPTGRMGPVFLFESGEWLLGVASQTVTWSELEGVTSQIYQSIFEAAQGRNLARIWNYVPAINQTGPSGLENYRAFCRGRSLAFERHHGTRFKAILPAASAVGTRSTSLTVVFAATRSEVRHLENPVQIPAYEYPRDYGPRAPSFARATWVSSTKGPVVFVSGTAAIRGHVTMSPGNTLPQAAVTLENLATLSEVCGLGRDLGADRFASRYFKVYLRQAADLIPVSAILEKSLILPGDRVCYLHADICREPLQVEIEATLM